MFFHENIFFTYFMFLFGSRKKYIESNNNPCNINLIIGKKPREGGIFSTQVRARIYFATSFTRNLRKHLFLLALRRWGRARRNECFRRLALLDVWDRLQPRAIMALVAAYYHWLTWHIPRAFLLVSGLLKIKLQQSAPWLDPASLHLAPFPSSPVGP